MGKGTGVQQWPCESESKEELRRPFVQELAAESKAKALTEIERCKALSIKQGLFACTMPLHTCATAVRLCCANTVAPHTAYWRRSAVVHD
jgi:hypothetical protein